MPSDVASEQVLIALASLAAAIANVSTMTPANLATAINTQLTNDTGLSPQAKIILTAISTGLASTTPSSAVKKKVL